MSATRRIQQARHTGGKARRILTEVGASGVAIRAVQRVVPRWLLLVEWFAVLETWVTPGGGLDSVAGAAWATPEDADDMSVLVRDADTIRERLAAGDRCALVRRDGEVVAHIFFTQRPWNESGLVFAYPSDTWWELDAYVREDHRGRRLHTALFAAVASELARDGRVRVISTIDVLNTASLRSASFRGARVIGTALVLKGPRGHLSRCHWLAERSAMKLHLRPRTVRIPG